MDWIEQCNEVIRYVEDHLDEDISNEELKKIAACSLGSFHRAFSLLSGITLSEYVRRRKMTLAAFELQSTDARVIDVAVKYGYETADAFGVAFKRFHGISPAAAKRKNIKINSCPRLSFALTVKGGEPMSYRVVEKGSFTALGKIVVSPPDDNRVPRFWEECKRDGTVARLREIGVCPCTLGLCFGYDDEGVNRYMVGVETLREHEEGMETVVIPASTWLVFESRGPVSPTLGNVWARIYGEFMPQSIYRQTDTPTLEVFCRDDTWADDYYCEVWIPVEKS
jgi:AraC family transcriptional regulator